MSEEVETRSSRIGQEGARSPSSLRTRTSSDWRPYSVQFNIFEAIGVIRQEVQHSDFFLYLIDPEAITACENAFHQATAAKSSDVQRRRFAHFSH